MAASQVGRRRSAARLFADGRFFTPDAQGALRRRRARRTETRTSPDYPLVLNTGRVRDHWHTMTRTGKSPRLSQHCRRAVRRNPPARCRSAIGIGDADIVRVSTEHGAVLRSRAGDGAPAARLRLRADALDRPVFRAGPASTRWWRRSPIRFPDSRPRRTSPSASERFAAVAFGFAVLAERPASIDADYWALPRAAGGWRLELASARPTGTGRLCAARFSGRTRQAETLAYHDRRPAGSIASPAFDGEPADWRALLAPEPGRRVARLGGRAAGRGPCRSARRDWRSSPGGRARRSVDRGATVCSCFGVGANQIAARCAGGCASVEAIGAALQAGTNCGSCRAEIRAIIEARRLHAAE